MNNETQSNQHPLQGVMETAMANLKDMVDANTIIGNPITTPDGSVIIPVSKVSIGFASGGSDFAAKQNPKLCFGGGSGAGLTMNPVAFLVVSSGGGVNMLPVTQNTMTALDKAIDMAPGLIDKIKDALSKKDKQNSDNM